MAAIMPPSCGWRLLPAPAAQHAVRAFCHDAAGPKASEQCPQRFGCSILNAGILNPFQRKHRTGKFVMRHERLEVALVWLQRQ